MIRLASSRADLLRALVEKALADPPAPKEVELLPCPFCGAQPKLFRRQGYDSDDKSARWFHWYYCPNRECGASLTLGEYTVDAARAKWNTRAPITAEKGERE